MELDDQSKASSQKQSAS